MTTASRLAEVLEVDAFLAADKTLTDALPEWSDSHIPAWFSATWPILDADGVALEGTRLVFSCKAEDLRRSSIRLLWRQQQIAGVDLVPAAERKLNQLGGPVDLPSHVSGSHFHLWSDNRDYALVAGLGTLPYRRPTPRLLTRLSHALAALAQSVNLTLTAQQASFDVPAQGSLGLGRRE